MRTRVEIQDEIEAFEAELEAVRIMSEEDLLAIYDNVDCKDDIEIILLEIIEGLNWELDECSCDDPYDDVEFYGGLNLKIT